MADAGGIADQRKCLCEETRYVNASMLADITMGAEHPELDLSPQEKRLYKQLFTAADAENVGVVTGEVAVKFFEKTRLPPTVLGEVRSIYVQLLARNRH